jgi:DNA adenine methylase
LSQSSDVLYEKLIRRIESTVPTVDVWRAEREAGFDGTVDDLAFRALFLNRCTFSGGMSLTANGPIGGYDQTGKWLIDARWKLHLLLPNLEVVRALLSARTVHVTSTDWTHVVGLRGYHYYDPPYITHNAKTLYSAYFTADEHIALRQHLRGLRYPWVLSYDDVTQVAWMYGFANRQVIKHRSTVQRGKPTERSEVLFWHTPRRRVIVRS